MLRCMCPSLPKRCLCEPSLSRFVLRSILVTVHSISQRQHKEEFILAHSVRVQSVRAGKAW